MSPAKAQRRKGRRKAGGLEPGRLCAFAPLREKVLSKIPKVPRFQHERRGDWRGRSRSVTSAFDDHCHRELWSLKRRDTEKPSIDPRVVVVHNHFIVLTNHIPAIVLLDPVSRLRLTSLRIVNRHHLLRGSGLTAGINARRFHRA